VNLRKTVFLSGGGARILPASKIQPRPSTRPMSSARPPRPAKFSAGAGPREVYASCARLRAQFRTRETFDRWCAAMDRVGIPRDEAVRAIIGG